MFHKHHTHLKHVQVPLSYFNHTLSPSHQHPTYFMNIRCTLKLFDLCLTYINDIWSSSDIYCSHSTSIRCTSHLFEVCPMYITLHICSTCLSFIPASISCINSGSYIHLAHKPYISFIISISPVMSFWPAATFSPKHSPHTGLTPTGCSKGI